jgi:hypothetical protein
MSIRKLVAVAALVVGLGGGGVIAAFPALVIGSTSDAGVVSCDATGCHGGPIVNPPSNGNGGTSTSGNPGGGGSTECPPMRWMPCFMSNGAGSTSAGPTSTGPTSTGPTSTGPTGVTYIQPPNAGYNLPGRTSTGGASGSPASGSPGLIPAQG